jgi:hypothetical protein
MPGVYSSPILLLASGWIFTRALLGKKIKKGQNCNKTVIYGI